jgi:hypothetical protein
MRKPAGYSLCVLGALVLLVGLIRMHVGAASDSGAPAKVETSYDCDVLLRGDGTILTVPGPAVGTATPATSAPSSVPSSAPAAPLTAWPTGSAGVTSCLRVREAKPSEHAPDNKASGGLGLLVAGALLLILLGLPFLVPTLLSEDDKGQVVSTTRVVVYALIATVVVNFMRRVFDCVDTGDLGVDRWLTGLAGVGIAAKVAQTFNEKPPPATGSGTTAPPVP